MKIPHLRVATLAVTCALLALFSVLAQEGGPETATESEFVPIFNGKDLSGWNGETYLWRVEDGVIVGETKEDEPIPYNKFLVWADGEVDDFELKLKYKITSGNSGIQIRSFPNPDESATYSIKGYQADIDAEGKWAGTNYGEGFGGILAKRGEKAVVQGDKDKEVTELGDPEELKQSIKDGDWNEYHVVAEGNHITQYINGVKMSEVIDERPDARLNGLVALQLHKGDPMKVEFKDIELKRLPLKDRKKVVFIAGPQSHGLGAHEHNAGALLLARLLNENMGDKIFATVYKNGWPADTTAIQNADAVVMYSDGQTRHVGYWHRRQLNMLRDKGVGFGAIHYAVEMLPDETNQDLISWIGGAFEVNYSVNPHWDAEFKSIPDHPVGNGVKPFTLNDEWYFNMRFGKEGNVRPILTAIPPDSTMDRPDGHHSGNPEVRKMVADKVPQHVCWVYDRPDGGRGFGFTGGHFHKNWQDDNFRKVALNAITWIAKVEVPEEGVQSTTPNAEEMDANQDPDQNKKRPPAKKKETDSKKTTK